MWQPQQLVSAQVIQKKMESVVLLYTAGLQHTKVQLSNGYSVTVVTNTFMSTVLVSRKHLQMIIFALNVCSCLALHCLCDYVLVYCNYVQKYVV